MNFVDFGQFLAGAACEKLSNCVSPIWILDWRFWIANPSICMASGNWIR